MEKGTKEWLFGTRNVIEGLKTDPLAQSVAFLGLIQFVFGLILVLGVR